MDYDDKRTCFLCKYVCVMSAIACQCDKTRVACCHHHKHMCDCPNSSKWLIGMDNFVLVLLNWLL